MGLIKAKFDFSDVESAFYAFDTEIKDRLIKVGEEAVSDAATTGDYQNRTYRLRNAIGYGVTVDGKLDKVSVPANIPGGDLSDISVAKQATERVIKNADISGTSLILADGMYYASFLENKNYDVIIRAFIRAVNKLNQ